MATIEFECRAKHDGEVTNGDGPTITLRESVWAYCSHGGSDTHEWHRIPPTTLESLVIAAHMHAREDATL